MISADLEAAAIQCKRGKATPTFTDGSRNVTPLKRIHVK
jgi:hypothetical protein